MYGQIWQLFSSPILIIYSPFLMKKNSQKFEVEVIETFNLEAVQIFENFNHISNNKIMKCIYSGHETFIRHLLNVLNVLWTSKKRFLTSCAHWVSTNGVLVVKIWILLKFNMIYTYLKKADNVLVVKIRIWSELSSILFNTSG